MQEAKAASALNHPNIVTIYDIRSQDGMDFIVMEYIEGQTLDELIAAKGMRPAQALKYAVQIADALAKAHGAGIVHRDLKPSNVMVTEEGRVKILDFGLAKLTGTGRVLGRSYYRSTREPLTEEGTCVGTAAYMSPEQAEGRKLDGRSDIFSFGSVLYEMVTGRKPFTGESRLSILTKILNEDPTPPSQLAASIPPELEKIILRCLRKDPARRYQTMADLKVALEDVEAGVGLPGTGQFAAGAIAAALGLGRAAAGTAAGCGFLRLAGVARAGEHGAAPSRPAHHATRSGALSLVFPRRQPRGIHVDRAQAGQSRHLRATDRLRLSLAADDRPAQRLQPGLVARRPLDRLPARRQCQEAGKSELRLIPPLGGPERKLAEIRVRETFVTPPYLAWCPDSNCLVVTDSPGEGKPDALFVVSLETGEKRQLTNPQPPALGRHQPGGLSRRQLAGLPPERCRRTLVSFTGFRWEEA